MALLPPQSINFFGKVNKLTKNGTMPSFVPAKETCKAMESLIFKNVTEAWLKEKINKGSGIFTVDVTNTLRRTDVGRYRTYDFKNIRAGCNASIPYGCQYMPQLLHFCSSFLLKGNKNNRRRQSKCFYPRGRPGISLELWSSLVLAVAAIWTVNPRMEDLSPYLSISVTVT